MGKNTGRKRRYALISVFDKTGMVELAQSIKAAGYEIISTGGTAKVLTRAGIPVIAVEEITGNPEAFGGRMKTISFQIESGILYNRSVADDVAQALKLHIPQIDIVVCNLYPFAETITKPDVTMSAAVENIDVGGPTMIRAAAKNFMHVLVVVDPGDYLKIIDIASPKSPRNDTDSRLLLQSISYEFRQELAAKAFRHLSFYDAQVAGFLTKEQFPGELTIPYKLEQQLRYGDNPDQSAALYSISGAKGLLSRLTKQTGRDVSATNVTDIDAGIKAVEMFNVPSAVIIKHNSPCGIALGKDDAEALARALESDSESAFGGVVVLNVPFTVCTARVIAGFKEAGKGQMDIIAAPSIDQDALELLIKVRKTTGVYTFGFHTLQQSNPQNNIVIRQISGGAVFQTENNPEASFAKWETVTKKKPTARQMEQMRIAWKFISRIRSNTIAVVDPKLPMTRGIGSGQTSRVLSVKIALERAGEYCKGGIMASDSFFPFDDCVKLAGNKGITCIVQQGGSIRDADSIRAADKAGIAMVFTHQRVFWH